MFDLLVKNARHVDGHKIDVAVQGGLIVDLANTIDGDAKDIIDAGGNLISAPFVDAHFHMDATLSFGTPRVNQSGTLLEGIQLWGELKPDLTVEAIARRAMEYCDWAIANGILAIRSHVDICDDRLLGVQALLEVKTKVKNVLDLQLVAFPQDGYYRYENAISNMNRALDMGVDVVGGIPHFEATMEDGKKSVVALMEIAEKRGCMVDMHCDETDDPFSRHIETLTAETKRLGMQGRVTGSHLTSMHSMDNYYVSKLLPLMAESGISVVANPLINILIQGRHDTYPKRRGLTRVKEMMTMDIPLAFGQDCVMDPWYSLGTGDMLDVANMAVHVGQLSSQQEIAQCFDAVTSVPAKILGHDGFGLAIGKQASFVVLQASSRFEAIRLRSPRLYVVSNGRVVARGNTKQSQLMMPGRPTRCSFQ